MAARKKRKEMCPGMPTDAIRDAVLDNDVHTGSVYQGKGVCPGAESCLPVSTEIGGEGIPSTGQGVSSKRGCCRPANDRSNNELVGRLLGDLDPCVLCGCVMHAGVERRYKQLHDLSHLLKSTCTRTPFVYDHILDLGQRVKKPERTPMCIACINWVRRLSKTDARYPGTSQRRLNREVPMIPMDNLLLFIHHPGGVSEPDKRSIFRLMQNLCIEYTIPGEGISVINPYRRWDCMPMESTVASPTHLL